MSNTLFRATTLVPAKWKLDGPLVHRTRILDVINSTVPTGMVTWIVGPLGSGKSTVALQWASEIDSEIQLISARPLHIENEEELQPPSAFGAALQNLLNVCSREPVLATPEEIAAALHQVVELSQQQSQPFIVDDLEFIRREAMITLQRLFIEALPKFTLNRAIFISRTIDSNVMTSLQARRSLRMVLPSTLEFDEAESLEAHRLGVFGDATLKQVREARERSGGWIAGMLADLHGHGGRTISPPQFSSNVLNNMILQQPPLVLRTMFAGALLPFNTLEIWRQWFNHLELPEWAIPSTLTQLPTRTLEESNERFTVVPAMSDALLRLLRISVSEDNLHDLLTIAMKWYVQNDKPDAAAFLATSQNLESVYLRLIKPTAIELARDEDWGGIANLVQDLPPKIIASDADIGFWYAFALASDSRWSDGIGIYYHVLDQHSTSENELITGRIKLTDGFVARAQGEYQDALTHFEDAYSILPKSAHQERMYAAASAATSASQIRLGPHASEWRRRAAFELAHLPTKQRWWHSNAGPLNLGYVASSGRLDQAYRQAEQEVENLERIHPELSWRYLLLKAMIDIERKDFTAASSAIARAGEHATTPLQLNMVILEEARLLAAQKNFDAAREKLKTFPETTGNSINNAFRFKLAKAMCDLDTGDFSSADLLLEVSAWPIDAWPRNFGDTHPQLIIARARAETGEFSEARELTNSILEEAKFRGNRYLEIRSRVILAHIYGKQGLITDRDQEIREATHRNTTAGYQQVFTIHGRDIRDSTNSHDIQSLTINSADRLSSREIQVIGLTAQSLSNKEIAERMFISVSTVKNHLASVYDKLGTNNRRAAVQIAKSHGIIDR